MEEYDVAIVGAGPAGSTAAYEISKEGLSVIMFEEDQTVGVPIQCGEGLSCYALDYLNIKPEKEFIAEDINTLRVIFPNGNWMLIHDGGYELNRDKFDQFLAKRATEKGCKLLTSSKVVDFNYNDRILKIVKGKESFEVKAKIVIGADGTKSMIAKWSGLLDKTWSKNLIRAYEVKMKGVKANGFDMYFDPEIAPGGYVWIFKKGEDIANVGIATTATDSVNRLNEFIKKMNLNGEVIGKTAGAIPYKGPVKQFYGEGVMIAGDAAGHTNPVFLGGISTAMQGGKLAGITAVKSIRANDLSAKFLSQYEKKWREMPYADNSLLQASKIMHNFTASRWEKMGELVGKSDVTNITALGKLKLIIKTFQPKYWELIPVIPYMPTVMKAFSITRKWGW